ncbi:MAG: GNAT family N-acetyltransferase [Candidatus Eisenbacteria bacterium]
MARSHRAARAFLRGAPIALRPMRRDEADALALSGARSFKSGDQATWRERVFDFDDNPSLAPGDTLVATIGGQVAGHASGYRFRMSLAGAEVPMRGIAAVAVLPEFRRRGVAEALMVGLHRQMRRRGEALSMLYAFRGSFYRKMGYGTVEWADDLRVTPDQLPASPLRRNARALDRARDTATLERLYDRWRDGRTGPLARHAAWWTRRVWSRTNDGAVYTDPASGLPRGYVLYDVPADPSYPRQDLFVRELVALDGEAMRGMLGYLEGLGDQFKRMLLVFPRGEGAALLGEYGIVGHADPVRLFETTGHIAAGALLRLVDVAAAFTLHPGPRANGARGRIGLDLADPIVPANARGLDVTFGSRGARVVPGRVARDRLRLPVDRLAQVYLGAVTARVLLAHGLAAGSPRAAETLDRAFAGPPCFLSPLNGF